MKYKEVSIKLGTTGPKMSRVFDALCQADQLAAEHAAKLLNTDLIASAMTPGKPHTQSRAMNRTSRLPVFIPIKVRGKDREGEVFEEHSRTIIIARESILIAMTHEVVVGADIEIENLAIGRSSTGRIVWRGGETNEVGVSLSNVEEICGIKFSPEHSQS